MGRPAGSKNAATILGRNRIAGYLDEAIVHAYMTMKCMLPCPVCDGKRVQKVNPPNGGAQYVRECQSCHGRGREIIDPRTRLMASTEIMDRAGLPKEKQVDHVSSDGSQVTGIRIIAVEAPRVIEAEGTSAARLMEAEGKGHSGD